MADLHVLDMSVTWRNILDLGILSVNYFKNLKELEKKLVQDEIIPNPDEQFSTLAKVSQTVCSLISNKKLFVPLFPIEIIALPNIERLSVEKIKKGIEKSTWEQISIHLLIHKSGVGMFKYLSHCDQKQTIQEAIRTVRKGIQSLVIKIPNSYYWDIEKDTIKVIEKGEKETTLVTNLRDLSTFFLNKYVREKFTAQHLGGSFGDPRSSRCISTTMIEVYQMDPSSGSLRNFSN